MSFRNKYKIQKLQNLLRTWVDVVNRPNFEQLGSIFDLLIKTYIAISAQRQLSRVLLWEEVYIFMRDLKSHLKVVTRDNEIL